MASLMFGFRVLGRSLGHATGKAAVSRSQLAGLRAGNRYVTRPILYPGIIRSSHTCGKPQKPNGTTCGESQKPNETPASTESVLGFWGSRHLWKRAGINTFRCLIGCSLGDFSAMWYLQLNHPDIGMGLIMGIAMASGLSTSMLLETVLLRVGRDNLTWANAAKTAAGMSFASMLGMETVQNIVDYHLTSGVVTFSDPSFWAAAVASAAAGFLAPLPWNYSRLKKYGKSCH